MASEQDRLTEALRRDKTMQRSSAGPAGARTTPSQAYGGSLLRQTGEAARASVRKKKGARSSSRY
jgi:hypothetical protein